MDSVIVYIGSPYVIKTPDYDFQKNCLRVLSDKRTAVRNACKHNTVGILNTYNLKLDGLLVSTDSKDTMVVVFQGRDECGDYLLLNSEKALQSLSFVTAGFVSQ